MIHASEQKATQPFVFFLVARFFAFFPAFTSSCGFGFMRIKAPISFLVSSKEFLFDVIDVTWQAFLLVGSYARYAWIISSGTLIVSWRMKRPISITAYTSHTEKEIEETQRHTLNQVVSHLFMGWAYVELMFDYTNLYIINTFETNETQLPVSLKPKIAFYKKHFQTVPELLPYQQRAAEIIERANRLKTKRHDIAHGLAIKEVAADIRRYLRHDYRGKRLLRRTEELTTEEMSELASEMVALGRSMGAVLREIGGYNLRRFLDNPDG